MKWTRGTLVVMPAEQPCLGREVFTSQTTLDEAQCAMVMASEVVPDPLGQRLRSRRLHLSFTDQRLVRVEAVPHN